MEGLLRRIGEPCAARGRSLLLGRRRFLQLAGAAATAVSVDPLGPLVLSEGEYINRRLGFSLQKPRHWHYLSYQEFMRSGEELVEDFDETVQRRELQGVPIVTIAKYYKTPPQFSPAIIIYAEAPVDRTASEEDLEDFDFSSIVSASSRFALEEETRRRSVAGSPGSRTVYSYDTALVAGERVRMRTTLVAALYRSLIYSFNFCEIMDGPASDKRELETSESSIRFYQ